jgi:hypothetical protein
MGRLKSYNLLPGATKASPFGEIGGAFGKVYSIKGLSSWKIS